MAAYLRISKGKAVTEIIGTSCFSYKPRSTTKPPQYKGKILHMAFKYGLVQTDKSWEKDTNIGKRVLHW